jgi:hypothetical protein
MLALIYLGLAIALGDLLCRRFYRFVSIPHRWAAATLVGILVSTWFTYLAGLAFGHTAEPLLLGNLLFFVVALGVDCCRNLLYASSAHMDSVLVFDLNGTRLGNLMPPPPDKLEEPSGLALFGSKLYVLCFSSGRVVQINL